MVERLWKSAAYGAVTTALIVIMAHGFYLATTDWVLPGVLVFAGMSFMAYHFIFDHLAAR